MLKRERGAGTDDFELSSNEEEILALEEEAFEEEDEEVAFELECNLRGLPIF